LPLRGLLLRSKKKSEAKSDSGKSSRDSIDLNDDLGSVETDMSTLYLDRVDHNSGSFGR
jgi:hypothetical protein